MYTILASYTTGDSFRSEKTTTELGTFATTDHAKEALRCLKEHHLYYKEAERDTRWDDEPFADMSTLTDKSWYVAGERSYEKDFWKWSCKIEYPGEPEQRIYIPYHGYFERLHSLQIQLCDSGRGHDNDMRCSF